MKKFLLRVWMSPWVKPVALVGLFLLLALFTFYLYPRTESDTYQREIVVALIGSLLTLFGAIVIAFVTFHQELEARTVQRRIRRFDQGTWDTRKIEIGDMSIPDIAVIRSGSKGVEWTDNSEMEWLPMLPENSRADIPGAELVSTAREQWIDGFINNAQKNHVPLTDDACVDLHSVELKLIRDANGQRKTLFTMQPALDSYYSFLTSGANLDKELTLDSGKTSTLRKEWGITPAQITDVEKLPCLAKVGVGTAVVTSDQQLVLGVRGKTAIAGQDSIEGETRKLVHFVAEGMIPEDTSYNGRINPERSARRGIEEELSISGAAGSIGDVVSLAATGFYFDQKRFQACFSYLAKFEVDAAQLTAGFAMARDSWEVEQLVPIRFSPDNAELIALMRDEHPDFRLASNHAASVLWFACIYEFGFDIMRRRLSAPL